MQIQTINAFTITLGALLLLAGPILEWKFRQYAARRQSFFTPASLKPNGNKIIDGMILTIAPMLTITGVAVFLTGLYFYSC